MQNRLVPYLLLFTLFFSMNVFADKSFYQQPRKVSLSDANGNTFEIGTLVFSENKPGVFSFDFKPHHKLFTDYFLSMKEMKCLEGPELWCHIPYPHKNPHTIEGEDYRWLEHTLVFMFKDKESFGANFWNGIYYTLSRVEDKMMGTAQHVDLNILAAPPEDLSTPPIGEYDIEEVDPKTRWLPSLIIE